MEQKQETNHLYDVDFATDRDDEEFGEAVRRYASTLMEIEECKDLGNLLISSPIQPPDSKEIGLKNKIRLIAGNLSGKNDVRNFMIKVYEKGVKADYYNELSGKIDFLLAGISSIEDVWTNSGSLYISSSYRRYPTCIGRVEEADKVAYILFKQVFDNRGTGDE